MTENDVIAIPPSSSAIETSHTSPIYHAQHSDFDKFMERLIDSSSSSFTPQQTCQGVNEETARIGRLLLDQTSIPLQETTANWYVSI